MKKFFDDELKFSEFRNYVNRRNRNKSDMWKGVLAVIGILSIIFAIVFAVVKLCKTSDEFDFDDFGCDDDFDENGCCFTDEEDFDN